MVILRENPVGGFVTHWWRRHSFVGVAFILSLLSACAVTHGNAPPPIVVDAEAANASSPTPDRVFTYRSSQGLDHNIHVFLSSRPHADGISPALVMFHGGGWKRGTPNAFYRQARVWNDLGITVLLPVYGLEDTHGAKPQDSFEDAFLAWQAIKGKAEELGFDPRAMAAGGGSAGGHLAAALATIDPLASVETHEPPVALVLFNPVIDNSPGGYAADRIGPDWLRYSPLHNIDEGHPPTLFMLGDQDILIPVTTGEAYCKAVMATGAPCRLVIYPGAEHGWFNRDGFVETLIESSVFLAETFSVPPLQFISPPRVDAFLLVTDGAGDYSALTPKTRFVASADHVPGGPLLRYEGPVVEGDSFAVRMYFDPRTRFDVFSKTSAALALRSARNNYHELDDWGRDTLFVGQTLGFGTPAVLTDGGLEVFSDVGTRSVETFIAEAEAGFVIGYEGWAVGGVTLDATQRTTMQPGTDYVEHWLGFDGRLPGDLVTGLPKHKDAETRRGSVEGVSYLLTYGPQSDQGRGLGLAIIYRAYDATAPSDDLSELVVLAGKGAQPTVTYWATADWELDVDFAPDIDAFEVKVHEMAARAAAAWSGQ